MNNTQRYLQAIAKRHAQLVEPKPYIYRKPTCAHTECSNTENLQSIYAFGYVTVLCPTHYTEYLRRDPKAGILAKEFKYAER